MTSQADDDDQVDPRVKDELDSLNAATDDINQWENEVSEERSKFKNLLHDATKQLAIYGKKHGNSIAKARAYYETIKEGKQAYSALERAVQNFQKSNGIHRAAKETISLAEQRLSEFTDPQVDAAWQEMLNIQTMRFMQAEKDRSRSEKIHQQATLRYECLQNKANKLKRKHKNSINKTRSYYEAKEGFEMKLQKQQKRVNDGHQKIKEAKSRYQSALSNLEKISLEIHEKRKIANLRSEVAQRREGEGCESPDDDGLVAMAKLAQFDLQRSKSYDDLDQLEEELDNFNFLDGDSSDEEDMYSSDDEWSGSSESSERLSSPSPSVIRRQSSRGAHRQPTNTSLPDEPRSLSQYPKRHSRKKLKYLVQDSVIEEDDVFENDKEYESTSGSSVGGKKERDCSTSHDVTYDTLHGVNSTSRNSGKDSADYDIFDDLC